jgi:hypothetical protein
MNHIIILKPLSALYDQQPVFCECCGPETYWESQYFYTNEIVDVNRINLSGLTENIDFKYIDL